MRHHSVEGEEPPVSRRARTATPTAYSSGVVAGVPQKASQSSPRRDNATTVTRNSTPKLVRGTSSISARHWTVSWRASTSETRLSAVTNAPRMRRPASNQWTMAKRPIWVRAAMAAEIIGSKSTTPGEDARYDSR